LPVQYLILDNVNRALSPDMKYGNATEPFGTGASLTYEHAIGRQYTLDQASPWFSIPLAPGAAVGTSDLRYSGYWYKSQYASAGILARPRAMPTIVCRSRFSHRWRTSE